MKTTRREVLNRIAQATIVAAVAPGAATAGRGGQEPDSPVATGASAELEREERELWAVARAAFDAERVWLREDLRSGPTYAELRQRLAEAIAEGSWERVKPLATECVRTGVRVAKILSDGTPIDEPTFAQTAKILSEHHRIIRSRMVLTARAQARARRRAHSGEGATA